MIRPGDRDDRAITALTDPKNLDWVANLQSHVVNPLEVWDWVCDKIEAIHGKECPGCDDCRNGYMKREREWAYGVARKGTSVGGFRAKQMVEVATVQPGNVSPASSTINRRANDPVQPVVNIINGNGQQSKKQEPAKGLFGKMKGAKLG